MAQQTTTQLPAESAKICSGPEGIGDIAAVWYTFFAFLASLTATAFETVTVGPSPYTFEASKIGHLHVAAGTVSSVVLQRGGEALTCPTSGFVPVVAGDEVIVTYTVAPTLTFVPGART